MNLPITSDTRRPDLHVLFKVGRGEYAVPASDVAQMESYSGATPIPGAAVHVAGIIQVRGRVVPVLDLRVCFGLDRVEPTLDSRVVITQLGERRIGLLVDSAREVVGLTTEQIQPPPPLVAEQSAGLVRAIAHLGPRVLMLVDLQKLIGEEQLHGE
jgi:purine-binding chemotaxis protein CheW